MNSANTRETILLELDDKTWNEQIDRTAQWFGNVLMTQAAFRECSEDAAGKIREPHIKEAIEKIAVTAKSHEESVLELYKVIGREPSGVKKTAGAAMSKIGQAAGNLQGYLGGAVGAWKDIHLLLLINLNSIGAFGISEQLGYALGIKEIPEIVFPIVHEKTIHQLLLQEYMLETGPVSILYKSHT